MTDEQKKDIWDIIIIFLIGLIAAFAASFGCTVIRGQNVVRNGYIFSIFLFIISFTLLFFS